MDRWRLWLVAVGCFVCGTGAGGCFVGGAGAGLFAARGLPRDPGPVAAAVEPAPQPPAPSPPPPLPRGERGRGEGAPADDGKLRIICFGAHPDDCELRDGG